MSWLRLPDFEAGEPELVYDNDANLVEVLVRCRPTTAEYDWCCFDRKTVKNGTVEVRYRDRRIEPAPTWLVVTVQKIRCQSCKTTMRQAVPHVDGEHFMTERLRDDLVMSSIKRTFTDASAVHAVEETLARRVFRRHADAQLLKYRFQAPRVLGIDENNLLGDMRGVIVDVEAGRLLDVYEGRTQSDIRRGMDRMEDWDNVEVWCQDMAGPYKGIAQDLFPRAAIVVDKFHVLMKANHWFTKVRIAETPKLPVEIRKKIPGMIRVFDMHYDSLSERQKDRVEEIMSHSRRLADAYAIKEAFYVWYEAPTRADAEAAYRDWVEFVRSKGQMTEWKPLMKTMQVWRQHIFNYFDHRYTSGVVERMNRSIADINRAANGMDFQTLRAKAILRYGNLIPEQRFKMFFMDASITDDDLDEEVLLGTGFDPSTLLADLEAGAFERRSTEFAG